MEVVVGFYRRIAPTRRKKVFFSFSQELRWIHKFLAHTINIGTIGSARNLLLRFDVSYVLFRDKGSIINDANMVAERQIAISYQANYSSLNKWWCCLIISPRRSDFLSRSDDHLLFMIFFLAAYWKSEYQKENTGKLRNVCESAVEWKARVAFRYY